MKKRIYTPAFPGTYWLRLPYVHDLDERDRRFQCRRTFEITSVPEHAWINVTGDAKYTLYVNGEFVNYGPARGHQRMWQYDRLDIAPYLRCGKNVIAAQVHKFGMGMTLYVYAFDNGFLLSGKVNEVDISTHEGWLYRHAPGYTPAVARGAAQHGFQEFFDCRAAQDDWFMPDYVEDESWYVDLAKDHARIAGCAPWYDFEERSVPFLTRDIIPAKKRISVSRHTPAVEDMTEKCHIYYHYKQEKFQWEKAEKSGDKYAFADGIYGQVIDLGEEMPCQLIFEISGAKAGDVMEFYAFEMLTPDGIAPDFNALKPHPRTFFAGQIIMKDGSYRHELSAPWGLRYVALWTNGQDFSVKISARRMWADMDIQGEFTASDEKLQAIWDMSMQAQRCCMVDGYTDCPGRENSQWWGDALVEAANNFKVSADASILARGLVLVTDVLTPNGLTIGVAPTSSPLCVMPDYTAIVLLTIYQHYMQTGSTEYFEKLTPAVEKILHYFRYEASFCDGLVPFDERFPAFFDWCPALFKGHISTLLNAIYLYALKKTAILAEAAGNNAMLEVVKEDIARVSSAIEKYLYDPESGLLCDGIREDDSIVTTFSPHAAAMAILAGILPEKHELWIEKVLLPLVRGNRQTDLLPTSYFIFYIFEALKLYGYGTEVIDCVRRWWGEMVDADCSTTPEGYLDTARKAYMSFCHAWSAHPLVHFSELLLGVVQKAPAWKKVSIEPLLLEGVDIAGKVPTPFGNISVSVKWNNGDADISMSVPSDIEVVNQ